jgi:hypothetical protein
MYYYRLSRVCVNMSPLIFQKKGPTRSTRLVSPAIEG